MFFSPLSCCIAVQFMIVLCEVKIVRFSEYVIILVFCPNEIISLPLVEHITHYLMQFSESGE